MAVLFLVFWGTTILFSTVAAPTYIPTNSVEGFPPTFTVCRIFNDGHSDLCEVLPHVVLICIYLIISDVEHVPIGHLYFFFGEMFIQIFCSFFDWIVCLCCCWVVRAVCIFWKLSQPLSVTLFADIFSHFVGCLFILFMVFFAMQKPVSLIRSHLFIFCFDFCYFGRLT